MPLVQIDNLGRGGINRDLEPYTLPPHLWSDGRNVRFLNQRAQKVLGSQEFFDSWNLGAGFNVPLWLLPWNNGGTLEWLAPSSGKIVKMINGSTLDVTRTTGGDYSATNTSIWSGGVIGGVPILTNDSHTDIPQSWNNSTGKMQDLPNWTVGAKAKIIRIFKQYVVALDILQPGGSREPHTVKWSNPALPGTVPTKWDNANDNDSNEQPLSEGGGFIIDAQPLRDALVVYKEQSTYLMQLTSGPFVFNFRRIFDNEGLLAPRCAKTFDNKHFVVSQGDVRVHDGQTSVSVIDKVLRNWMFNNIQESTLRQTFVTPNYANNEMWICFITNSVAGTFADIALIWNWKENTWGIRDLPDVPHIAYGLIDKTGVTSKIIDDQTQIIDTDTSVIDGSPFSSGQLRLAGVGNATANDKLIEFDITTQEQGANLVSFLERTGIIVIGKDQFGEPKLDQTSLKLLSRLWLKLEATGAVDVYIGSQSTIEGAITWSGPFPYTVGVTPHIDTRVQGVALAIKIESTGNIEWSCTGVSFNVEIIGGATR